eukprot:494392_1
MTSSQKTCDINHIMLSASFFSVTSILLSICALFMLILAWMLYHRIKAKGNKTINDDIHQPLQTWMELSKPPFLSWISHILTLNDTHLLIITCDINTPCQIWIYNIYSDNYTKLIDNINEDFVDY